MLSPFVQQKCASAFLRFDVNRDGLLGEDDFAEIGRRVAGNLGVSDDSERYEQIVAKYRQLWKSWSASLQLDSAGTVSLLDFLEAMDVANSRLRQQPEQKQPLVPGTGKDLADRAQSSMKEFTDSLMMEGPTAEPGDKPASPWR